MSNDNHQPDYVIRKKRSPKWYWSLFAVAALVFLLAMALGYWLNSRQHTFTGTAKEQFTDLQSDLDKSNAEVIHWKQQYEVEHQITAQLQTDFVEQQREVANLKKELQALQRIFDPDAVDSGLQIASLVWSPLSETHYSYRLMLIQAKQQSLELSGIFKISVVGEENSEPTSYDFRDIGGLDNNNSKFKFKYAQSFSGNFKLPVNFKPRFIRVVANTSGRGAVSRLQDFEWQLPDDTETLPDESEALSGDAGNDEKNEQNAEQEAPQQPKSEDKPE